MIHTVKQGEYLSKIARRYGFSDYKVIWDHPANAEFKNKRKNPNVLHPGDRLVIPDKNAKTESAAAGQRHRYRLKRRKDWIRLHIKDLFGRDLADRECTVHLGPEQRALAISDDGTVELEIPVGLEQLVLIVEGATFSIRVGELDPVEHVSGQRERLLNLGYHQTDDGSTEESTSLQKAIRRFQEDHGLEATGVCDDATSRELLKTHGC